MLDNAYAQGLISQDALGISFAPASAPDSSGVLTFGGVDESKTVGPVNYVCVFQRRRPSVELVPYACGCVRVQPDH